LEQVKPFKYLGSIANGDNPIEEKLKKALPWAVKLIMPIKKYVKANYYQRKQI